MTDYLRDRNSARGLAQRIEKYHHARGDKDVRVWVETDMIGKGTVPHYVVRSNIVYYVPS